MNVRIKIFLLITLLFSLLPGQAAYSQDSTDLSREKALIDNTDHAAITAIIEAGGERLVDYGGFSLWLLPSAAALRSADTGAKSFNRLQIMDENIYLRGIAITTPEKAAAARSEAFTEGQQPADPAGEDLWMIQFIGPVLPEWEEALRAEGLQVAAYIPNDTYLVWGEQMLESVEKVTARTQAVQWSGPYLPEYRLAPELRGLSGAQPVEITVQVLNTPGLDRALAAIGGQAQQILVPPSPLLNTTRISLTAPAGAVAGLASMPGVINIEPYQPPEMLDEIQGQAMAGSIGSSGGALVAARPGYLQWLEQKGFPMDPDDYPLVDIFDDGIDSGFVDTILHPDFHELGNPANPGRIAAIRNCTSDPGGNSAAGHGNLNAGILAGYNDRSGTPYEDSLGYQLGLGISPFGRIAATKIFGSYGVFSTPRCGGIDAITAESYASGARITSNSWGKDTGSEYDTDAMMYDALTRDASPDEGDQAVLHVFAAGNSGAKIGASSIGSPGTAKNVLTVGAAENPRDPGVSDGCLVTNSNSLDDVAEFSSIGPTTGGRAKPDILAPGTHVQGPASQDPAFNGSQVCGGTESRYYPSGQTLYTWSSGTSHSAPAVSGTAQLIHNYYKRVMNPGHEPSPALVKALILNTPRYMTGERAGDTLPSPYQGWGSVDMGQIFDDTPRQVLDQEIIFDRSGAVYETENLRRIFSNRPVRVSLVWTDAPGSPAAARALVNDLDLEVTYQGQVYRGNAFSGAFSLANGERDFLNNVENIFLPPGSTGTFSVRVIARNLTGDGIPNRPGSIDQDFALVIYNGVDDALFSNNLWVPFAISQSSP